jgi:hypothetical protein
MLNEFHPNGIPTTVSTPNGPVQVYNSKVDKSPAPTTKPEFNVFFTFDTLAHTKFTFMVTETKQ